MKQSELFRPDVLPVPLDALPVLPDVLPLDVLPEPPDVLPLDALPVLPDVPPLDVLPAGLAGVVARFEAYRRLRAPSAADELAAAGRVLVGGEIVGTGHAVGEGRYTGRACAARSVEDALERLEPGDVLVCPLTSPSHDPLFTIAGAVVTEEGGPMGHTAVMARETGVPAVVGTGTVAIVDGGQVLR